MNLTWMSHKREQSMDMLHHNQPDNKAEFKFRKKWSTDLKHKKQFLSKEILESIWLISRDRDLKTGFITGFYGASGRMTRVSTEVTFWHSAEYGSDFRCNSGEIPRNSAEFRGISPELRRNHFRSQKIPRNSVSAEFRGHPTHDIMESLQEFGLEQTLLV